MKGSIQTAFREVSDALIQYRKVREIRAQQELLVTTLQDRSSLAYMRYRGGVDTLLNALDADRDLFNAELRLGPNQTQRTARAGSALPGPGRWLAVVSLCQRSNAYDYIS